VRVYISARRIFIDAPFSKKFLGIMSGLSPTRTSNLKSGALTVLELLAFNAQKFTGSHDPVYAPFRKILGRYFRTVPE